MGRLIPPIRELSPRAATLLADLQSVDVAGIREPGSGIRRMTWVKALRCTGRGSAPGARGSAHFFEAVRSTLAAEPGSGIRVGRLRPSSRSAKA